MAKKRIYDPNVTVEHKYQQYLLYSDNAVWISFGLLTILLAYHLILIFGFGVPKNAQDIMMLGFGWWYPVLWGVLIIAVCIIIPLNSYIFKEPEFDDWLPSIAQRELDTEVVLYQRDLLYINYDVRHRPSEIREFILDITSRSEDYGYYLEAIDTNNALFSLRVKKKINIPNYIENEMQIDQKNEIYLGLVEDGPELDDLVWNYKYKDTDDYARSILTIGDSDSGKDNLNQVILSNLTNNKAQIIDINTNVQNIAKHKRMNNLKNISYNAKQASQVLNSLQESMYYNINNKFEEGQEVNYYDIMGHKVQFDELLNVRVDNKLMLLMAEEVFNKIDEGKEVELLDIV